uniref:Uncharacterized protein n=1 Tax=Plectus sambesii TaxID=2011161 RepID=A0A914XR71_9BILA
MASPRVLTSFDDFWHPCNAFGDHHCAHVLYSLRMFSIAALLVGIALLLIAVVYLFQFVVQVLRIVRRENQREQVQAPTPPPPANDRAAGGVQEQRGDQKRNVSFARA